MVGSEKVVVNIFIYLSSIKSDALKHNEKFWQPKVTASGMCILQKCMCRSYIEKISFVTAQVLAQRDEFLICKIKYLILYSHSGMMIRWIKLN